MGPESVADAGPLIHLAEIGALSALEVFSLVHVPEDVWVEAGGRDGVGLSRLATLKYLRRHSPDREPIDEFARTRGLTTLHRGEQAALYLCRGLPIPLLLTDDLAARAAAQRLGITPVGSLGVVVRASRVGLMPLEQAERHVLNLYEVSSLFVTRAVVELAIEQLRAAPPWP